MTGVGIIVSLHQWPLTFLGLSLTGAGLANMVPVLFEAAGRAHERGVGQGVATVSMIGYFGFMMGPPVIGVLSHGIGLPGAFLAVGLPVLPPIFWGPSMLASATKAPS